MENLLETIIISSMIYTFYKFILNYEFFSEPKLYIKYNNKYAQMPYRATKESAGLDLFSCDDGIIEAHSKKMIDIGISKRSSNLACSRFLIFCCSSNILI